MASNRPLHWYPSTLGERLRFAADRQPREGRRRGIRLFQERIKGAYPDLVGCALSTIQSYANDVSEPSLEFLRASADVLSVRYEWLAVGQGQATEKEEAAAQLAYRKRPTEVERTLKGGYRQWSSLNPHAQSALAAAWAAILGPRSPHTVLEQHGQLISTLGRAVARDLGRAVDQPLQELGLASGVIPPETSTYVVLVCEAIRTYAEGHRRATLEFEAEFARRHEEEDHG